MINFTIGRNPSDIKSLKIVVEEREKALYYSTQSQVSGSVSREHCSVKYDEGQGTAVIKNLKDNNITTVNRVEISQKTIVLNSSNIVCLGGELYPINIASICSFVTKNLTEGYSVRGLEEIWNSYQIDSSLINKKIKNFTDIFIVLSTLLSIASIVCLLVPSLTKFRLYIIPMVLLMGLIYKLVMWIYKEKLEKIKKTHNQRYVCPVCKKSFTLSDYHKEVQGWSCCPYCKAKYDG